MAASSWTRWSRSTRTDVSISRIQDVIVAASMTLSVIKRLVSDPPAQGSGVHRRVPKLDELLVELEHGQRRAGHLEGGDVAADEIAHRLESSLAQLFVDLAINKVELEQRRAAHAVDEREHLAAALGLQVRDHGLDHHVDDLAGRAQRPAAAPWLTMDADTELDLALGQLEDDLPVGWWDTRGQRHTERT